MNSTKQSFIDIYHSDRSILVIMALNAVLATGLLVFSLINLNTDNAVVKIGYSDIGGYRDGTWVDMIAYPLLALTFGFLHSFLALRIFRKRGNGMTKLFLMITSVLILGTFLVLVRLLGEG